jgi:hypothetical protein
MSVEVFSYIFCKLCSIMMYMSIDKRSIIDYNVTQHHEMSCFAHLRKVRKREK